MNLYQPSLSLTKSSLTRGLDVQMNSNPSTPYLKPRFVVFVYSNTVFLRLSSISDHSDPMHYHPAAGNFVAL